MVFTKNGPIKFRRNNDGLYTYKPKDEYLREVERAKMKVGTMNIATTVKENQMGYTQQQFEDARKARRLYHIMGCPTVQNFKHILRQNIIKNCPVTIEDVNNAEKIFGPDIGTMKGKTTRSQPPAVKKDNIEIPKELLEKHQDLILYMDVMFINNIPLLTSIDGLIRYRSLIPLQSRDKDELYRGIDAILRNYNKAGFRIKELYCDGEFKALIDEVKDELNIDVNYTARGEHVPQAERNNRTIGE